MELVAVQLFVFGLYRPPVFTPTKAYSAPDDHLTASPYRCVRAASGRAEGAGRRPTIRPGLYLPPVFNWFGSDPPQTIISLPVHTAVWPAPGGRIGSARGCPTVCARDCIYRQCSTDCPFISAPTIISLPVQTAVL